MIAPMGLAVTVPVDSTDAPFDSLDTATVDSTEVPIDSMEIWGESAEYAERRAQYFERTSKFTIGGGGGRYYREILFPYVTECGTANQMAPFEQEYNDVGAELDFQTGRTSHAGVRGGYIWGDATFQGVLDSVIVTDDDAIGEMSTVYINPYFSFEGQDFGIGLGALISTNPLQWGDSEDYPLDEDPKLYPTGHLRIGRLNTIYLSGHLWEGVPVYSGGGAFMGGLGVRPMKALELYAGYCAEGPYQEDNWMGRVTIDLTRSWTMLTTLRFPVEYRTYDNQEGFPEDEFGFSVGLSYRWYGQAE